MSQKRILMLSAGAPSEQTSGLGDACQRIGEYLSQKVTLTIVQPDKVDAILTHTAKVETTLFSAQKIATIENDIVTETIRHQIASNISVYGYSTQTESDVSATGKTSEIKKQLDIYTQEIIKSVNKEVKTPNFDLVYAHDWFSFDAGMDLQAELKVPLVLHVHATEYDRNAFYQQSWVFELEKKAFEKADHIICVSEYSKKILIDQYTTDQNKISVAYLGHSPIKPVKKPSSFHEKIVLFVGRLTHQKGAMMFLEIAEKVNATNSNTRFVMAGDGDQFEDLVEASADTDIADRFHLTGYLDKDQVETLYAQADVLCMPSASEPFGLVAMEAAAAKLPIVLSANSGVAEVLPSARRVDPSDSQEFANAILDILAGDCEQVKDNQKALTDLTWESTGKHVLDTLLSHCS